MRILLIILVFGLVGAAGAADFYADPAPPAAAPGGGDMDSTRVLKWDNGTRGLSLVWNPAGGNRIGNDFDVSTVKSYPGVTSIRMYSSNTWPDNAWQGMRYRLYEFEGNVVGSYMWPPSGPGYFFKPSGGSGYRWFDVPVDWVLPGGTKAFVAACEQVYEFPTCDSFALDSNAEFLLHTWEYYQGSWLPFEGYPGYPYKNLMLRVVVDNDHNPAVAPSSLGRVKALYY